mmetsp:Transcript_32803/g.75890  ORF Transcript_32803/g.75890 Transcript_32803/m.75890 type:complete len:528 (-) Transcript_32803:362-1945(-)
MTPRSRRMRAWPDTRLARRALATRAPQRWKRIARRLRRWRWKRKTSAMADMSFCSSELCPFTTVDHQWRNARSRRRRSARSAVLTSVVANMAMLLRSSRAAVAPEPPAFFRPMLANDASPPPPRPASPPKIARACARCTSLAHRRNARATPRRNRLFHTNESASAAPPCDARLAAPAAIAPSLGVALLSPPTDASSVPSGCTCELSSSIALRSSHSSFNRPFLCNRRIRLARSFDLTCSASDRLTSVATSPKSSSAIIVVHRRHAWPSWRFIAPRAAPRIQRQATRRPLSSSARACASNACCDSKAFWAASCAFSNAARSASLSAAWLAISPDRSAAAAARSRRAVSAASAAFLAIVSEVFSARLTATSADSRCASAAAAVVAVCHWRQARPIWRVITFSSTTVSRRAVALRSACRCFAACSTRSASASDWRESSRESSTAPCHWPTICREVRSSFSRCTRSLAASLSSRSAWSAASAAACSLSWASRSRAYWTSALASSDLTCALRTPSSASSERIFDASSGSPPS